MELNLIPKMFDMKAMLIVQNLKCGGCVKTIISKISDIEHVSNIQVDIEASSVSFEYKDFDDAILVKDKLKHIGYPSMDMENTTMSRIKSFVSCASGKMGKS